MKPNIAISQCLLGKNVRFNSGHCRQDWIVEQLLPHVNVSGVCPEVEMGLGVPRPAMHLHVYNSGSPQLIVSKDHSQNLTEVAVSTSGALVKSLDHLDGHILKKGSPSCGLERAKLYVDDSPMPKREGVGIYAEALIKKYPSLPVIEEGRLSDPQQAELFVLHVFSHYRFRAGNISSYKDLQLFHRSHKFLLMSQSPGDARVMGRIASGIDGGDFETRKQEYYACFTSAFRSPISDSRRVNAVTHVYGMLKDQISESEKKFILDSIDKFGKGQSSFATIMTLLCFLIESHKNKYLLEQVITEPYPETLVIK